MGTPALAAALKARLGEDIKLSSAPGQMLTLEVAPTHWVETARILRDDSSLAFEQMTDLCGLDYLGYGRDEGETDDATREGFSRRIASLGPGRFRWRDLILRLRIFSPTPMRNLWRNKI